ncbi:MAG TPA: Gfo/Idh/MocA family oxidoreductase [Candidatus Brocadiia bacterium]|nr:Gfo/Idh/MocA family oxidoreductase [Candidatus Brocadiia bacterium]
MAAKLGKVGGPVRLGFIGCGGISKAHALGVLEHKSVVKAVALCDVNEAARKTRNAQLGGGLAEYSAWTDMLAKEKDNLDAVVICLPHHLHKQAIVDACAAGKHVLCEKPLCMTLAEADAIAAAVEQSGVTYMSAHNQLFLPIVAKMKEAIEAGKIGRPMFIRSQDCFRAGRTREEWAWRADLKTQGGGEFIDTGYHPTYRLFHLAGAKPVATQATFGRFLCPIEGEDSASVHVRFANGVIGEIYTSWAMPLPYGTHQLHVVGDEGEVFGSGGDLYLRPLGWSEPAKAQLPQVNTFVAQMEAFAKCLIEGRRPPHSVEEGRMVLEMILAATASAQGWQQTARK